MNRLNSLCGIVTKNDMKTITEDKRSDCIFDMPPTTCYKGEDTKYDKRYRSVVFNNRLNCIHSKYS